jgi:uncharacterized membrane protein HdeD (DUF308 family)
MTAGLFFLKFRKNTGDTFFVAFAASFLVEGMNRAAVLMTDKPNEGSPWTYVVRLLSFLLILAAIAKKNYGSKG